MANQNGPMGFMDALAMVSFMIGLANYSENVDQSQLQDTLAVAMSEIHGHLQTQDLKIDHILSLLEGGSSSDE